MLPKSTPQMALLLFHNAIGRAYGEVTPLGWQGWRTEGESRRIEEDAIAMISDGDTLSETLHDFDPGPAIEGAQVLAREFFTIIRTSRTRQPINFQ